MPLTLLLDLDDTLLESNMDTFIPSYFKALSRSLEGFVEEDRMLPALLVGTRLMMLNNDPACLLRQVFDDSFFPALGLDREKLQQAIDHFYEAVFPELKSLTRQKPEAVAFVEWAFQQQCRVAIATNPLFPLKAIQHRLDWAGLPHKDYQFALVSSYETFHFTKTTPAYYAEVVGRLGCHDDPVVMVGDDLERDILPSRSLGLTAFWIRKPKAKRELPEIPQGTLVDLRQWLEHVVISSLKPAFGTPMSLLSLLRATPAVLDSLTLSMPEYLWEKVPGPDEWSPEEIVGHLLEVERDIHIPHLEKILPIEPAPRQGKEAPRRIDAHYPAATKGRALLGDFCNQRKHTLSLLEESKIQWEAQAQHMDMEPAILMEKLRKIAEHDRIHLRQFAAHFQDTAL